MPSVELIQQLFECCDSCIEELPKLKDQVSKLIEIKQKIVKDNSGGASLSLVADALKTIENMQKIEPKLSSSTEKIKTIREQAEVQFRDEVSLKHKAAKQR